LSKCGGKCTCCDGCDGGEQAMKGKQGSQSETLKGGSKMHTKCWKNWAVGAVVLIMVIMLAGCPQKRTSQPPTLPATKQQTIKIGAVLPLTGDAAVYGKAIKDGIDLALSEVNTKGGVKGRRIEVIYEDDQGKATIGVSATQKLIAQDKVPVIIGGAMSSVCAAIGPICQRNKVVLLSPTASAPSLRKIGNYLFFLWPSDNYDGKIMAEFAYKELGIRSVAILYVNLEYGKGIEAVFRHEFEKLGGKVVASEAYAQGATDFRAQLSKIKALSPDALYLPGYYKELAGILKQARQLGLKTKILSVNSFYDPKLLQIAGDSAEGAIFTYPMYDPKNKDAVTRKFVDAFKKKYGKEPDIFAAQGYDALNLVALAISKGGFTAEAIREELSKVKNYPGVGGTISFDKNGDVIKPLRLLTVRKGRFEPFAKEGE
jgi:branched-chain amino acid transport system substrate-binding protein